MKPLKPYLRQHDTPRDAVARTIFRNVTAVRVKNYLLDKLDSVTYWSYKTRWDGNPDTLRDDFPLALGSNQSIEEIDANDY